MVKNRMVIKVHADQERENEKQLIPDVIAKEAVLRLYVNDTFFARLECTPVDLSALVIGYLYTNGWMDSLEQLGVPFDILKNEAGEYEARLSASLNQNVRSLEQLVIGKRPLVSTPTVIEASMSDMDFLLHDSEAFQETGCIHSAGLFRMGSMEANTTYVSNQAGTPYYTGEDISRYYAMYKAIGKALLSSADLTEFCLCTTGRLPVGYMERVIRAGISCVISRSAPTDAALLLAEKYQILTFGFAGRKRINIYPTLTGCSVLAGGQATRMGGVDKSKLFYQEEPFLNHIQKQFPTHMPQYLSYNRAPEEIRPYCKTAVIVPDYVQGIGPLGGLAAVLHRAGLDGCIRVLVVACDMPLFHVKIAEALLQEPAEETDAIVIRTGDGRVQSLCGIYYLSCLPVIEQMIEEKCYKLQMLLKRVKTRYLDTETYQLKDEWFKNVNTQEDLTWKN